jgi:hypothetical protein
MMGSDHLSYEDKNLSVSSMNIEAILPKSLKNYSLNSDSPNSLDELISALYWYADTQVELAKKRQQIEVAEQWEHRVKALDGACQILDEINQDDSEFLIY